ncbi:glycerol-3-phosphate dehydrogenase subunit GlpB [Aestuariimicrobium ganziense]|uniref:glycerol-3-phosphate dehydrogenase subunit GlpB n=1 Tax=Aestuariimicrobium ganziense TaxID=2773677 RepID=UPI00194087FF|nr:glycerol-3-phosphate dehydrogenase subunit GlpB [Aestuariimicrobium ganziense]
MNGPVPRRGTAPRTVVVGAGLAGLVSAILLRRHGHQVVLVAKGLGGLQLSQGTIDVLGRLDGRLVDDPWAAFDELPDSHPYRRIGVEAVRRGVDVLAGLLGPDLLAPVGERNQLYPTAVGALRPTLVVPPSMAAGAARDGRRIVIVGIDQVKDFHPELVAGNLARTELPGGGRLQVRHASIDLGARPGEVDSSPVVYARALDQAHTREKFVRAVKAVAEPGEVIGLPAVLGVDDPLAWADLQQRIGQPVFEIALQPPSVPGMRFNQALLAHTRRERVRTMLGAEVIGLVNEGSTVTGVRVQTAGGERTIGCDHVVHAPGGFESGALAVDSHNRVSETIFGLPVTATDATELIHGDYWGAPQPLFEVGVRVDDQMRVLDDRGRAMYANLYAAGGILAGAIRWREKSGEGIALGSAVKAVDAITAGEDRP